MSGEIYFNSEHAVDLQISTNPKWASSLEYVSKPTMYDYFRVLRVYSMILKDQNGFLICTM